MTVEETVRAEHPEWTDEQVAAEVTRRTDVPPPKPDPKPDEDRDRAFAEQRRKANEAEQRARAAEQQLADIERTKAEQAGEWEKLAKQYETERDQARQELADLRTEIKVEKTASRLKFKNTDEALALLPRELDRSDDQAVADALEALATNRPHLIDNGKPGPTGLPAGSSPTGLTLAEVQAMSPAEINSRWEEVQPVLAQQSQ